MKNTTSTNSSTAVEPLGLRRSNVGSEDLTIDVPAAMSFKPSAVSEDPPPSAASSAAASSSTVVHQSEPPLDSSTPKKLPKKKTSKKKKIGGRSSSFSGESSHAAEASGPPHSRLDPIIEKTAETVLEGSFADVPVIAGPSDVDDGSPVMASNDLTVKKTRAPNPASGLLAAITPSGFLESGEEVIRSSSMFEGEDSREISRRTQSASPAFRKFEPIPADVELPKESETLTASPPEAPIEAPAKTPVVKTPTATTEKSATVKANVPVKNARLPAAAVPLPAHKRGISTPKVNADSTHAPAESSHAQAGQRGVSSPQVNIDSVHAAAETSLDQPITSWADEVQNSDKLAGMSSEQPKEEVKNQQTLPKHTGNNRKASSKKPGKAKTDPQDPEKDTEVSEQTTENKPKSKKNKGRAASKKFVNAPNKAVAADTATKVANDPTKAVSGPSSKHATDTDTNTKADKQPTHIATGSSSKVIITDTALLSDDQKPKNMAGPSSKIAIDTAVKNDLQPKGMAGPSPEDIVGAGSSSKLPSGTPSKAIGDQAIKDNVHVGCVLGTKVDDESSTLVDPIDTDSSNTAYLQFTHLPEDDSTQITLPIASTPKKTQDLQQNMSQKESLNSSTSSPLAGEKTPKKPAVTESLSIFGRQKKTKAKPKKENIPPTKKSKKSVESFNDSKEVSEAVKPLEEKQDVDNKGQQTVSLTDTPKPADAGKGKGM